MRLCALALILVAARSVRAADVDRYLPNDAQLIVHVNLREVLDAPLTRMYALDELHATLQKHDEVRQTLDAFGLDPFRDLLSVTIGALPGDDKPIGLAVIRGRFDPVRVRAAAEQYARDHPDQLKVHARKAVPVYEAVTEKRTAFAALLDREVLLVSSSRELLAGAIARRDESKSPSLPRELRMLVAGVDGGQSVWFAGVPSNDMIRELSRGLLGRQRTDQVKTFTGGVRVGGTIQADVHIETASARAASDLRKVLEGLKSLTAFAVANNRKIPAYGPLASDLIRACKITLDEETVNVRARITATQIEKGLRKGRKP
jgi:hypothetical protein